jgi:hypothetical protein
VGASNPTHRHMEHTLPEAKEAAGTYGRRREVRLPCTVTVVRVQAGEHDAPATAQLVEISSIGMQLHTEEPMSVGTRLTIDTGGMRVRGAVRHCEPRSEQSYTVGVLLCDVRVESLHGQR